MASWVFGIYLIRKITKEKQQLKEDLIDLRDQHSMFPDNNLIASEFTENTPADNLLDNTSTYDSSLLDEMALEIQAKESRIKELLQIKDNQQNTQQLLQSSDPNAEILGYMEQLEADFAKTEKIIADLQDDLNKSRHAMKRMEQEIASGNGQSARIFALEEAEYKLRNENTLLHKNGQQIAEKLELRNQQIKHLKGNNTKLKKALASLTHASKEQLAIINKLHAQVERAEQLENHQRELISNLEARLSEEKTLGNDLEKVNAMEAELESLKDTLQRTLIEKEFIEEHMIELDDSLEKAKETEVALARAQKEIASLEKHFPEFEPKTTETTLIAVPSFTTDIAELNNIMDNHRLFGSIQEFWMTLELPPLTQVEQKPIPVPDTDDWVHIVIGEDDYSVLLSLNPKLTGIVSKAIFNSHESKHSPQDTTGELCNIIAGTLATELDNNFSISVPKHINHEESQAFVKNNNIISEVLLRTKQKDIYAVLTAPKTP